MKSAYVKPTMSFEAFRANEFVAACFRGTCVGSKRFYYQGNTTEQTHTCNLGEDKTFFYNNGVHGQGGQNITYSGTRVTIIVGDGETQFKQDLTNALNNGQYGIALGIILSAIFGNGYTDETDPGYLINSTSGTHISASPLQSNGASAS